MVEEESGSCVVSQDNVEARIDRVLRRCLTLSTFLSLVQPGVEPSRWSSKCRQLRWRCISMFAFRADWLVHLWEHRRDSGNSSPDHHSCSQDLSSIFVATVPECHSSQSIALPIHSNVTANGLVQFSILAISTLNDVPTC